LQTKLAKENIAMAVLHNGKKSIPGILLYIYQTIKFFFAQPFAALKFFPKNFPQTKTI
jgi:hypothetical protein